MHFKQTTTVCKHPAIEEKNLWFIWIQKVFIGEHTIIILRDNFGYFAWVGNQKGFLIIKIRNKVVVETAAQ